MSDGCGAKRIPKAAGGWAAILYALRMARETGGYWRMWKALRSKNACKTCAVGMGGQSGGMVNEHGHFPEVCKKSVQAMAADMRGRIGDGFFDKFGLEELRKLSSRELEAAGRITEPLCACPEDTHYRVISWDDAFERIARKLKATPPDESFFYFSGRSSNEAGFLLQLFARLYGTNNVNNCSYYCHQASGVGLSSVYGSGTASLQLEDVENCDLLFVIGANPASNHPRLMSAILRLKRRGGKVIVVNPLREIGLVKFRIPSSPASLLFGTTIADIYVQPHIGGDIAFLAGVAKAILESGSQDKPFIANHTESWPEFEQMVTEASWDTLVEQSGVSREVIQRAAEVYANSAGTVFAWAMGITHHEHGVKNVQMIANVALMRGMLGKPNAGLLPIRGHSNVQGIGSMGVAPKLRDEVFSRLQNHFGVKLPISPGLDTMGCLERAEEGKIRFAFCLGGNLYGSNPDSVYAQRVLSSVDLVVYLNTTLNTGHAHGTGMETIILPVLARDEERQSTTQESMFNYVRLSDGGPARHANLRSEVEIISRIARDVLDGASPVDWTGMEQHGRIREAIAAIVPGYEAIGQVEKTKEEFQIGGRTFRTPKFKTPSGRAKFHSFPVPPLKEIGGNELRLMTIRSEGQFNTVVYEEEDYYRGQERRDVILLNPLDRIRLGLAVDQQVTVRSDTGALRNIRVREIDNRPGNAVMYYPEANVLVPRVLDGASGTPAFKNIMVRVLP
ncbi:MAG: FdhF/YdeP family oxidoreductase [Candidatus Hydrogenedentes bacterium]|nr:FdhF/YdeP family oxidoreductase [Candidatus Hydrogenedentota bacterium]